MDCAINPGLSIIGVSDNYYQSQKTRLDRARLTHAANEPSLEGAGVDIEPRVHFLHDHREGMQDARSQNAMTTLALSRPLSDLENILTVQVHFKIQFQHTVKAYKHIIASSTQMLPYYELLIP